MQFAALVYHECNVLLLQQGIYRALFKNLSAHKVSNNNLNKKTTDTCHSTTEAKENSAVHKFKYQDSHRIFKKTSLELYPDMVHSLHGWEDCTMQWVQQRKRGSPKEQSIKTALEAA